MKPWDWVALVLSVAATAGFTSLFFLQSLGPAQIQVETPEGLFLYPLDKNAEYSFQGPLGQTHLDVQDGQAFIHDSPCTNQLCVHMGSIRHSGQWVACLPNRIFVRIIGGQDRGDGVDIQTF